MATVNANNITLGGPEQSTTGAVLSAPLGTAIPATATETLAAGYESSGFVTEDGVSIEYNLTITHLRDWAKKGRRTVIDEMDATVSLSLMEISYESLVQAFGADAVTQTAASASHGTQLRVGVTGELPPARTWVFNMKDGNRRTRLVLPNAQVTNIPNMTFQEGQPITIPIEISCYPDETTRESVVFLNDDGETA